MKENEKILKELRKREFQCILKNKEFIIDIISKTLELDKEYVIKHLKLKKQNNYNQYDLITKITETRIKIRTSEKNNIIEYISGEGKFHIAWYDEKNKEFKVKIYLDRIFEHCYKDVQKHEEEKIKKEYKERNLTKEDLINISIVKTLLSGCEIKKITVYEKHE